MDIITKALFSFAITTLLGVLYARVTKDIETPKLLDGLVGQKNSQSVRE